MAQPGGVLTRAGHTEAGCDLARLAGLEPAAVIVEILNDDGTMARRDRPREVRARARAQDRHDRRSDPLPAAHEGALGRAHRRARTSRPSSARSGSSATRITSTARCTSRSSAACSRSGDAAAGARAPSGHAARRGRRAATRGCSWPLRGAMRARRRARAGRRRAAAPEESPRESRRPCGQLAAAAREPGAAARQRDCARSASARRSCAISACGGCACSSAPKQMHGLSAFGLEVVEYVRLSRPMQSSGDRMDEHQDPRGRLHRARPAHSPSSPRVSTTSIVEPSAARRGGHAADAMASQRQQIEIVRVPGAFELPLVARSVAASEPL